jgi:hypothetical protein
MKGNPAVPGGPAEEYADVVEHRRVFGHVGFFFARDTQAAAHRDVHASGPVQQSGAMRQPGCLAGGERKPRAVRHEMTLRGSLTRRGSS